MRSSLPLASLVLFIAARLPAQDASAPITNARSGVDVFVGFGLTRLSGMPGVSGKPGVGVAGVAFERPVRRRYSWRAELAAQPVFADVGRTGLFSLPTTLSIYRVGIAGVARRYAARGTHVGLGISVATVRGCDFDREGGPGSLGGETISCDEFDEIAISPAASLSSGLLTAGIERKRLGLELRYDLGLQRLFETTNGGVRPSSLNFALHYRFGRSAASSRTR
jgi:hypothetical protein